MSSTQPSPTAARPLRTGDEYLRSLRDGRQVFIDGERVKDVPAHPAFREAARAVARLYDIAAEPANRELMTFASPKTGAPVLRAYQIPKSHADLKARRLFHEKWAEATFGLMGRSPDHVAGFFCGYAGAPEIFAAGGQRFADNVVKFYERMRDEHLYVSYAIVPPQIDRSKPAHKQSDPALYAGVVKERDDGIVISGAQQLATGGPLSDWLQLACIHPLQPGDENYANAVCVPIDAPGLKLYPRRPFALNARNSFDHPLSSRFDESDAYVVFDNVFVPWEHVFIYRNPEISRDQWWKTPAHLLGNHQAQCRYVTKLRFMVGLAQRMNEMTGNAAAPPVQVMMGELAALVSIYEALLHSHEATAPIVNGVLWPHRTSALFGDGDAVGIQRPDAGDDPRARRRGLHHAAVVARRPGKPADRARHGALHALGFDRRQGPCRADAVDVGLHRLGIRQPPPAVREILRRCVVPGEDERQPLLRLETGDGAGRRGVESAGGGAVSGSFTPPHPEERSERARLEGWGGLMVRDARLRRAPHHEAERDGRLLRHHRVQCHRAGRHFPSSPSSFHRFCAASTSLSSGQTVGGKRRPPRSGSGS
jgi:4-hydroxyphenylacetate 3-monooxygenase